MLHLAWDHGQLAVIGWQGRALPADRARSLAASLFGSELAPATFSLTVPQRGSAVVADGAVVSVGQLAEAIREQTWVPWRTLSASLGWAAAAATLSIDLVDQGQVVPSVDPENGQSTWVPMIDARTGESLRALTETMPPVFGALHPTAKPWQLTAALVNGLVDAIVRQRLWGLPGGGPDGRDRRPVAVVSRRLLASLASGDPVLAGTGEERAALQSLASELDRWSSGLTSRSPLVDFTVFLRIQPCEFDEEFRAGDLDGSVADSVADSDADSDADPGGGSADGEGSTVPPWAADLFVAPTTDPSLFVGADTVWGLPKQLPPGVDGPRAQAALRFARSKLLIASPTLGLHLNQQRPSGVLLPFEDIMKIANSDLDAIGETGVVVQLPLWWTKPNRVRTVGRATPTEAPITGAGMTAKAIVSIDWRAALGDLVLTEKELQRLALAKYDIVSVRGRWSAVDRESIARALTTVLRFRNQMATASAAQLLTFRPEDGVELTTSGWAHQLMEGGLDDRVEPIVSPHGFTGTLRPYQQRGVGWLAFLSRVGLGGVLADDMGLGKTAQLLALIAHESQPAGLAGPDTEGHLRAYDDDSTNLAAVDPTEQGGARCVAGPTLVVCPMSVIHNWETESARFTPWLRVGVHHGSNRTDPEGLKAWVGQNDLVITTYATATRDAAALADIEWQRLVIDEAQHVKNTRTNAARALRRIPARQRIALTGTPVENRLADLWSVMDLVNPGFLGQADHFRRAVAVPIERHRDEAAITRLRTLISPVMLRRSKADKSLVPELPPKIEATAWATLTREQASLYRAVTDRLLERLPNLSGMDRRGAIVAAITRLKQICNHPAHYLGDGSRLDGRSGKLARFDELVNDAFDVGDRVIAFTQYVEMGELVQRHLGTRLGSAVPFLNGSVPKRKRDAMVNEFQSGNVPLLLVSLKAGGSGLNLTAASQVIHIDRWWNPAVEDQASDRAWRIGQTSTVFVHRLATRGTIEERIDRLMNEKRALAESVIGAGEGWITELSTDDLRRLITLEVR